MKRENIEEFKKKYKYEKYRERTVAKFFTKEEYEFYFFEYCFPIEKKEFSFLRFLVFLKEVHIADYGE